MEFQRLLGQVKDMRRKGLRHGATVQCLDASQQSSDQKSKLARLAALNSTLSASDNMLTDLGQHDGFDIDMLRKMRVKFTDAASGGDGLSREEFFHLLRADFPALAATGSVDALFDAFDSDGNGTIDYQVRKACVGCLRLRVSARRCQHVLCVLCVRSLQSGCAAAWLVIRTRNCSWSSRHFQMARAE